MSASRPGRCVGYIYHWWEQGSKQVREREDEEHRLASPRLNCRMQSTNPPLPVGTMNCPKRRVCLEAS